MIPPFSMSRDVSNMDYTIRRRRKTSCIKYIKKLYCTITALFIFRHAILPFPPSPSLNHPSHSSPHPRLSRPLPLQLHLHLPNHHRNRTSPPKPPYTLGYTISHFALVISDPFATIAFYRDVLVSAPSSTTTCPASHSCTSDTLPVGRTARDIN